MMKKSFALLAAALIVTNISLFAQDTTVQENQPATKKGTQLSFIYPMSTDGPNSKNTVYNFSFNVLGGITGGVNGAEFGGLFNINQYKTSGVQFAGLFNKTESLSGVQFAGLFNYAAQSNHATQFAGIINYGGKQTSAVQFAGIGNIADKTCAQIAGITNVANESGFQLAVVNVARKSKFQLGIVNVSDSANMMLGLVNVSKNGFMEVEAAGGELLHAALSFRSGTDKLYGIVSIGYNFKNASEFWGYGAGIGTTIKFGEKWGLNLEGIQYTLATKKFKQHAYSGLTQIKPAIYRQFGNNVKLFVAPTANLLINSHESRLNIDIYNIWEHKGSHRDLSAWVGFSAGLRIRLH